MSKNATHCSCIIPVFNEGERILSVLKIISQISSISQIICVDDGSTDNTVEVIKMHYPEVTLLCLTKNVGKSGAIAEGVKKVTEPYVLFMDADLRNLQKHELEDGIEYIFTHTSVDMLIFRRKNEVWFSKILRGDLLVSGERIVKLVDLQVIFQERFMNYQVEPAINYYMQDMKKNVCWKWHSGKNVMKAKKIGLYKGSYGELKYFVSVLRYKGVQRYLSNVTRFFPRQAF